MTSRQRNPSGITVVLPNFNHAAHLTTSLSAIVDQSQPFDEILVVDDASTDDSLNVIGGFARRCPQLRIICNEKRIGVAASVNRGIAEASESHIVLASADEKIARNASAAFHGALKAYPDLRLAVSCYSEWDEATGEVTNYGLKPGLGMWYATGGDPFYVNPEAFLALLKKDFVWLGINTAVFSRSALLEVGGLDPTLQWHSDWFAIYSIAFRYGFCAIPRTLASFRLSPNSYSARGMGDPLRQRAVMRALVEKTNTVQFSDIGRAIREAPSVLSPFVRPLMLTLVRQPRNYGLLAHLMVWWWWQVARFRRPGPLLRVRERLIRTLSNRPSPTLHDIALEAERFDQVSSTGKAP